MFSDLVRTFQIRFSTDQKENTRMKRILILLSFYLLGESLSAQTPDSLKLSAVPTVQEITSAFVSAGLGRLDPFLVLPAIIASGDAAVPALGTVLFSDSISQVFQYQLLERASATDTTLVHATQYDTVKPNKLYAAMALEGIGSGAAYTVLIQAAQAHPDLNVRGLALNALAITYHNGNILQHFTPGKELVHLLLNNVDDTTMVPYFQKSLGQTAREGLINWTGWDMGKPQGKNTLIVVSSQPQPMAISAYREQWWQSNASSLKWNGQIGRFNTQ